MNSITPFVQIYAQLNAMIVVGFLLLKAVQKISGRNLRFAQLLLFISISAPIAVLVLVPAKNLPRINFIAVDPPIERPKFFKRSYERENARKNFKSQKSFAVNAEVEPRHWLEYFYFYSLTLFLIGLSWTVLRKIQQIRSLRRIIDLSVPIRSFHGLRILLTNTCRVPLSFISLRYAYVLLPFHLIGQKKFLKIALQHELQHHRSYDTHWIAAFEVMECLFYLNPFIYLWRKQIAELQEFACDHALVQRKISYHDYASCLIKVAEDALHFRSPQVGTAGMASFLRRRIEMLADQGSPKQRKFSAGVIVGIFAVSSSIAIAYGSQRSFRNLKNSEAHSQDFVFDQEIETIATQALLRSLSRHDARAGYVVVSDPSSGKILAVSNLIRDPEWKAQEKYWALNQLLEPASLVKTFLVAGAIQLGVTTSDESLNCENGNYQVGGQIFHEWKTGGFDHLSTAGTVIYSSNICGIKVAEKLTAKEIEQTLLSFGFGKEGVIPAPEQLPGPMYNAMMGSGYSELSVSPLEVVQAFGAIANGGYLMKPLLNGESEEDAMTVREVLTPEVALEMKAILARAVSEGTGVNARSQLYSIAGKTATSYSPSHKYHDSLGGNISHGSFVGFAPIQHPRILVSAGVFQWKDHEPSGNMNAAPVVKEVIEKVLKRWGVPTTVLPNLHRRQADAQ